MAFTDDIAKLSDQVRKRLDHVSGEEATKQSLILPFFAALGFDIYDPTEVKPEFVSDAATKKAGQFEKVDYAIRLNNNVVMLVEAKAVNEKVASHDGQLRRYYTWTTTAKVGIVTNGIEYRFFTDLRKDNIMDDDPFLGFNILEYTAKDLEDLKFFHRDNFDPGAITQHAEEIVYTKAISKLIGELLRNPSEEFIRFLLSAANITDNRITSRVIEKFRPIIKKSIQTNLVELMTRSLSQEIQIEQVESEELTPELETTTEEPDSKIDTTHEELEAFDKIKGIVNASSVTTKLPIQCKDTAAYFGINCGKTNWWFARLYLSSKKKNIVLRLSSDQVLTNLETQDVSGHVGCTATRIFIDSITSLDQLAPIILQAYELEANKH